MSEGETMTGCRIGPSLGSDAVFGQDDRLIVAPYRPDAFF